MLLVTRKVAGGRPAKNIWVVDASGDVVQVAGTHLLESIWRSTNFMVYARKRAKLNGSTIMSTRLLIWMSFNALRVVDVVSLTCFL